MFESAVLTLLKLQIKYQAYVIECELKNLLECIEPMDPEVVRNIIRHHNLQRLEPKRKGNKRETRSVTRQCQWLTENE